MHESLSQDLRPRASGNTHTPRNIDEFRNTEKSRESLRDDLSSQPGVADPQGGLGTHCEITGQNRKTRYRLQAAAVEILDGAAHPKSDKGYRIRHCQRSIIKDAEVSILKGPNGRAKFGGLQTCGSVWNCPCCSHKITRLREQEIATAMDAHFAAGGRCLLVTYTHPHTRRGVLLQQVDGYTKAMGKMTGYRAFKELVAELEREGKIVALELTYGEANGWHNHGHEAWLLNKALTGEEAEAIQSRIFPLWKKACVAAGLPAPSPKYGVDVRLAFSPAEYLAKFDRSQKWGTGAELAKANSKRGTAERFTPFDFLRAYAAGHQPEQMAKLFREFAFAFHGKRQIRWSDGLKAKFGIGDKTDEELAAEKEAEHEVGGVLSVGEWRKVIARPFDVRVRVLEAFERGGINAARQYIAGLDSYQRGRRKGGHREWTNLETGEVLGAGGT